MGDVQTIIKDARLEFIENHVFLFFTLPQNTASMADLHLWVRKSFQCNFFFLYSIDISLHTLALYHGLINRILQLSYAAKLI